MSARCVRVALQSCTRTPRFPSKRLLRTHGLASASPTLHRLPLQALLGRRRVFSSTSGHGEGDAGAIAGAPAAEPTFPWRGAPNLIAQPENMLTKMFLAMFTELDLSGEDLKVGAEAAFVCAASSFFKMRPSEVRGARPTVAGEGEGGLQGQKEERESVAEATSAEGDALAETEEAEAKLVVDALEARLVAFPSDEGAAVRAAGAVPYYRLHEVVAAAITKKRVIVGGKRGDDVSDHLKRVLTPSWVVLVDMENVGGEIESAMAGHTAIVLQVDVDLACDETFYVKDGENGKVIQGKESSTGRIHRVRLESSIGTAENQEPPRWKVVDLDNWLRGNPFW